METPPPLSGESPADRARTLYALRRYALAAAELRPVLARDPGDGDAHALLALCLLNEGRLGAAGRHADLAVAAWPDDSFCHYARACVLKVRGKPRQAADACAEAVRLDPYYVSAWHKLGAIRLDQEEWRAALECADMGLAIDPHHEGCAVVRANALLEMGRYAEADDTIQRLLAEYPESVPAHTMRGWYLLDRSRPREAMEAFGEALRMDADDPHARSGLVRARAALHPLIRLWRATERPLLKWMHRLPRSARWIAALLYAILYVGVLWVSMTVVGMAVMLVMVVLGLL